MKEQPQQRLTKEEFAKAMSEKRQALFNMANEQVEKAVESTDNFLTYLNLQSRLNYTVTNTLLVMHQNPKATQLKDLVRWREDKKFVRKGEKGIQILEPYEYKRNDGNVGISYHPKYVFDITQLQGLNYQKATPEYSSSEIISAILYKTDIKPEVVNEESTLPERVYFDQNSQTIYVCNGLDEKVMMNELLREYCYAEYMAHGLSRQDVQFKAECSAYMLSKKFGIGEYNTLFAHTCAEYFFSMNPKEIKDELENITHVYQNITQRMNNGLYAQQEQSKQKTIETVTPMR